MFVGLYCKIIILLIAILTRHPNVDPNSPIVVPFGRVLQGVLVEVLSAAAELCQGGQLEDSHRPLQDGDGLLVDPLLLGLGPRQISGNRFLGGLVAFDLGRAAAVVVFTAPEGNFEEIESCFEAATALNLISQNDNRLKKTAYGTLCL